MFFQLVRLDRREAARRADELLKRFDLAEAADRPSRTSSGGMRRRLDLASSLLTRPRILFLDEPTTGLDPRSRNQIWAIVGEPEPDDRPDRLKLPAPRDGLELIEEAAAELRRADIAVSDLGLRRPTLDDVFLQLTGAPPSEDGGPPQPVAAARSTISRRPILRFQTP